MKAYTYSPQEAGLTEWPSGILRLEGIHTADPEQADIFICPGSLELFRDPRMLSVRLKYFRRYPEKHVLFDISDYDTVYNEPSLFIRCNLRPFNLRGDPNSIAWPWPVEDFKDCIDVPLTGFKFDVSFQGWVWSDTRKLSTAECSKAARRRVFSFDFSGYSDFYGYLGRTPTGQIEEKRRRQEYVRSLRESRLALCPESIPGVFPYRFYEAMSAARVPVLIGDDFQFPFADEIPYQDFMLHISRSSISETSNRIRRYLDDHNDQELIQIGWKAREYYDKFLHRDKWVQLQTQAVIKKLNQMGVTVA